MEEQCGGWGESPLRCTTRVQPLMVRMLMQLKRVLTSKSRTFELWWILHVPPGLALPFNLSPPSFFPLAGRALFSRSGARVLALSARHLSGCRWNIDQRFTSHCLDAPLRPTREHVHEASSQQSRRIALPLTRCEYFICRSFQHPPSGDPAEHGPSIKTAQKAPFCRWSASLSAVDNTTIKQVTPDRADPIVWGIPSA